MYFKPVVVIVVFLLNVKMETVWFALDGKVECLLMQRTRDLSVYIFIFILSEKSFIMKRFAK